MKTSKTKLLIPNISSDSWHKMGDELSGLLEIFKKVKEAGFRATLTATTKEGKTKFNLEIVSPPATAPPPLQPVSGHARRRHRGAAARARRRKRAADHRSPNPLPLLLQEKPVLQLAPISLHRTPHGHVSGEHLSLILLSSVP